MVLGGLRVFMIDPTLGGGTCCAGWLSQGACPHFHRLLPLCAPAVSGLEEALGVKFPTDLAAPETRQFLLDLCAKHHVVCTQPQTPARLIDKLVRPGSA